MRTLAIAISPLSCCCGGGSSTSPAIRLSGLGVFQEDIAAAAPLGTLSVVNVTGTPTYVLDNSDGGRVILTGANLTRGIAWDYETHPIVTATISVSGVTPSIAPRTFLLFATNVLETILVNLTLNTPTVAEDAAIGTTVGAIVGKTFSSNIELIDTAGGRFAKVGNNIATAAALDYEAATSHSITLRETHADAAPRDSTIAITVTDVAEGPPIGPFTLAWTSATTELTNLSFSITPAPLVGDVVTLSLDGNSDMSSPFDTSDPNTVDSGEAGTGTLTFTGIATPLSAGLTYARVAVVRGVSSADSSIASITLVGGDTTAPVLSSPTGTKTGSTTATLTVSTNEANGTLYGSASASAPSKAQIKAGQTSTGAASTYAFNQAVSATGVQTKNATGLTASTTYTMHYMHEDSSGNQSNVASASSFTTDAAVSYVGPGDVMPGAVFWAGLRAYSAATAGTKAIRIRATGDNAETDINTTAAGALDVAAVSAFLTTHGGNAAIVTWYDKSGSAREATQPVAANQAQLVLSGIGALPVARFVKASSHNYETSSGETPTRTLPLTHSMVAKRSGDFGTFNGILSNTNQGSGFGDGANSFIMFAGAVAYATCSDSVMHALQAVYEADGSGTAYVDTAATAMTHGTTSLNGRWGIGSVGGSLLSGDICEAGEWSAVWNATQAGNMDANQSAYWGI